MSTKLNEIEIVNYRGIRNLHISNLKKINVIVGDNNSGKTSFLEAISMFANTSIGNVLFSCGKRVAALTIGDLFTEFVYAFPNEKEKKININAVFNDKKYELLLQGNINKTLVPLDDLKPFSVNSVINEVNQFDGILAYKCNDKFISRQDLKLNAYNTYKKRISNSKDNIERICYVTPTEYSNSNISFYKDMYKNEKYKQLIVEALKIFDPYITDLMIIPDEFGTPIQYINNSKIGITPVSTYGDGVKKIITIAAGLAVAHDGILLIDEFETGLHIKNYDDVFVFVQKACEAFNVQLFLTTHSIEAVDELLKLDSSEKNDEIIFVTLRKDYDQNKTLSRIMTASEVKSNREKFDFEVRL